MGIENHLGNDGLQYTFNNVYPTAAMPLSDGDAILITTDSGQPILMGDVNQDEVLRIIENHSIDVLIHGHTHRPDIHDENGVPRMVLGDWGDFLWFIESSKGDLHLVKEKI